MLTLDQVRTAMGPHAAGKSDDELRAIADAADRIAGALVSSYRNGARRRLPDEPVERATVGLIGSKGECR